MDFLFYFAFECNPEILQIRNIIKSRSFKIAFFKTVLFLAFSHISTFTQAQDILKKVAPIGKNLIDTLFIDNNMNNWSLRTFVSFKDYQLELSNDETELNYVPNNPYGMGFGYANSKIRIDVGFNIKGKGEEVTDRFDMQGDLTLNNKLIVFQVQNYKGFEVESKDDPQTFREDIKSLSMGLYYMFLFNSKRVSLSSLLTGMEKQKKNAGTFMAGIFSMYNSLKADSSIIPYYAEEFFNDAAQITRTTNFSIGLTGGYTYHFVLPWDLFLNTTLSPGIGLSFKNVTTETSDYSPGNILLTFLNLRLAAGYNGYRHYIELSAQNAWFNSSLGFGNQGRLITTRIKLAYGWKLFAKDAED